GGQLHGRGQSTVDNGDVARGQVPVQVGQVLVYLDTRRCAQASGVDARAGDNDHAESGHEGEGVRVRGDGATEQMGADAGPADGDEADLLVVAVAERRAQFGPIRQLARVEPGHVAGEVEVLSGPFKNAGQGRAEGVRDDVLGIADEQGAVAQGGQAGD